MEPDQLRKSLQECVAKRERLLDEYVRAVQTELEDLPDQRTLNPRYAAKLRNAALRRANHRMSQRVNALRTKIRSSKRALEQMLRILNRSSRLWTEMWRLKAAFTELDDQVRRIHQGIQSQSLTLLKFEELGPKRPTGTTGSWAGDQWNKGVSSVTRSLREKTDRKQLEKRLKEALHQALGKLLARTKEDVPASVRQQLVDRLVKELMKLEGVKHVFEMACEYLQDVAAYLEQKITLSQTYGRLRQQIKDLGGLMPGEDKAIQAALKPQEERLALLEEQLKVKWIAQAKLKLSLDPAIGFLKSVSGVGGFKIHKSDFATEVKARVTFDKPLSKGASVKVEGVAAVRFGAFLAQIAGSARVEDVFTDPRAGKVARLKLSMSYTDDRISSLLYGSVVLPLRPDGEQRYEIGGSLGFKIDERTHFNLEANKWWVHGPGDGYSVKFNIRHDF